MTKFRFMAGEDEEEIEEWPFGWTNLSSPRRRLRIPDGSEGGSSSSTTTQRSRQHKRAKGSDGGSEPNNLQDVETGLPVMLMDPEVLDCSICMEPLSPPVFQCENGHIACSTCCTKLGNKCPSCTRPIGHNRCLAIEKVIESIKVACGNKSHGCTDTFSYSQKRAHEDMCTYAPCLCPISDCDFRGSSKQLSLHFSDRHRSSAKHVVYNCPVTVSFGKLDSYIVLQVEEDDTLFLLNNQIELVGSALNVTCLGAGSSSGGFSYDLIARKGCSSLRLQSQTKFVKERNEISSCSADFLLIPYNFYGSCGKLKLEICIWK